MKSLKEHYEEFFEVKTWKDVFFFMTMLPSWAFIILSLAYPNLYGFIVGCSLAMIAAIISLFIQAEKRRIKRDGR